MSVPKLSIIIVNWNGKKWLNRLLSSLSIQSYKPIEIIVVDNGSTDESVSFIKERYPRVKVVKNGRNLGFAGGVNSGIKKVRSGLVLLINNDTWVEENFVADLVREKKIRELDVIGPIESSYDGVKRSPEKFYASLVDIMGHAVNVYGRKSNRDSFYLTGVCLLFERALYIETVGLDSNFFMYCEEVDWFWRLRLVRKTFAYSKETHIFHKGAASTGSGLKRSVFLWRNENTLQMLIKNYQLVTLMFIIPIYVLVNLVEVVFFTLLLRPEIASTYIEAWKNVWVKRRTILHSRSTVQRMREISDIQILKVMSHYPAKLQHLLNYNGWTNE